MDPSDVVKLASAAAQGKRPYFFSQPDTDRLLSIVMALVAELAVERERLDTLERLLARNSLVRREEVEAFRPSADEARERGQWQIDYLSRVFRLLEQEAEALRRGAAQPSAESVAEELAKK